MSGSGFPMHGYVYDAEDRHGLPIILRTPLDLGRFLVAEGMAAYREGHEVRITSQDDDDCYVHIAHGTCVYASGVDPQRFMQVLAVLEVQYWLHGDAALGHVTFPPVP